MAYARYFGQNRSTMKSRSDAEEALGKSSTLYHQGREAMAAGDLESSIRFFEESAQIEPHFKTLELLGECFLKRGQHGEAIIPLAASVGLGNKPYRALYLLARALHTVGRRAEAIEKLNQTVQMKPDYKSAKELLDSIRASG